MPRHNAQKLFTATFPSRAERENNEAKTCTEMAFRLHHYEALIRDKESLQMPLFVRNVARLARSPWANRRVLDRGKENRKGNSRSYFSIASAAAAHGLNGKFYFCCFGVRKKPIANNSEVMPIYRINLRAI